MVPICNIDQFSRKLFIRYMFYSVCVTSCMDCVIVEGDSFTAQMEYVDDQKGLCKYGELLVELFWTV